MNLVFVLVIMAVVGLAFFLQKQSDTGHAAETREAVELAAKESSPAAATATPNSEASQPNYMKRALDRARDVRNQSRARTQAGQDP